MTDALLPLPPVAIGGVGGSGTRLAARILSETGCYIGDELNGAFDNLWFSVLLRRKSWFHQFPPAADIGGALRVFRKAMEAGLSGAIDDRDQEVLDDIRCELLASSQPLSRTLEKAFHSLTQSEGVGLTQSPRWGWKEPNTHIFLPDLARAFPDLRYVHVIRNGLDMAFSENQQQLNNWGPYILGVGAKDPDIPLPVRSLEYWLAANRRAIKIAREAFGPSFFLLNYDRLCADSGETLSNYLEFLDVDESLANFAALIAPLSIGRHKNEDLSIFSRDRIRAVRELMALD